MPPPANPYYPRELQRRENLWLRTRRAAPAERAEAARLATQHPPTAAAEEAGDAPVRNVAGLALSGGGIRSATFCLGVLQALADKGLARRIDFLSTVSGGGYIGSFFGAWISRERRENNTGDGGTPPAERFDGAEEVERQLPNLESREIRFLRENGRFLAPNGAGDAWNAAVVHVRNWLSMLVVIGTLALMVFVAGEAAKLALNGFLPGWGAAVSQEIARDAVASEATGHVAASTFTIEWSPFWRFAKWIALLGALPLGAAYWIVYPASRRWPSWAFWLPLGALVYLLAVLPAAEALLPAFLAAEPWGWCIGLILVIEWCLWADYRQSRGEDHAKLTRVGWVAFVVVTAAFALILLGRLGVVPGYAEVFARWPGRWIAAVGALAFWHLFVPVPPPATDSTASRRAQWLDPLIGAADFAAARSAVTKWLARFAAVAGLVAVFALIDSIGQTVALHNGEIAKWAWTLLSPAALVTFMQTLAPKLLAKDEGAAQSSGLIMTIALWLGAGLLLSIAVIGLATAARLWAMTLWGEAGSAVFEAVAGGAWATAPFLKVAGVALGLFLLSTILGHRMEFVNLSAHHQLYSARLTRAYLGASNPRRRRDENWQVTETVTGDQVEYGDYQPQAKGGPLHLINVTVNETVSGFSNVEQRDRKGFSFAVGPAGLSVRRSDHALFAGAGAFAKLRRAKIAPVEATGRFHVFGDTKQPSPEVEMPPLGAWVGMSGAAFTTGLGARTSLATSLLLGLLNVRLGYWWNSDIPPHRRDGRARQSGSNAFAKAFAALFPAHTAFADELLARFHGVARRHWYLSDGGHFENTACYELIRRRVPFIICCDCGCDGAYTFEDVANLVRKARLDFGAGIEFLDEPGDFAGFPEATRKIIGPLSALRQVPDEEEGQKLSRAHAALAKITYVPATATHPAETGWLLLIKPTLTDALTRDVLHYASQNPDFPQQTTMDQFFDEAQWESYRQLGWQIGQAVFSIPQLAPDGDTGWKPKGPLPPPPAVTPPVVVPAEEQWKNVNVVDLLRAFTAPKPKGNP